MPYIVVTKNQIQSIRKALGMDYDPNIRGYRILCEDEVACHKFGMKPWLGAKHTEETKTKIGNKVRAAPKHNYRKPKSKSHRENISKAAKARKWFNDGNKTYRMLPEEGTARRLSLGMAPRKNRPK